MTKDKYDVLAKAWTDEDNENLPLARKLLADSKPWSTFTEDIKKIEEEILVSHHTPDNVKKQAKKIIRIRGKKQYLAEMTQDENGKKVPQKDVNGKIIYKLNTEGKRISRVQQGDTVRGSLHQDSIYGAIKNPLNQEEIRYVIRKDIESIKATDVENIVDEVVKEKVKEAIANKVLLISSNPQQKNKIADNQKVWMNEEKGIPIQKVRLYANSVKNPLHIKEHSALSKSRHEHKQKVYGVNGENYAMAIYEGLDKKGNTKRGFELLNYMDAGNYYKLSNDLKKQNSVVPDVHFKSDLPLKYTVKKGDLVLFYNESKLELEELEDSELVNRLYKVIGFESDGRIQFRHHKTAMQQSSANKEEMTIVKYMADNSLKNSQIEFENPVPWLRLTMANFNFLLNNIEFKISSLGKVRVL